MKIYPYILFPVLAAFTLGSCGADDELAADVKKPMAASDSESTGSAPGLGENAGFARILDQVTELKAVFRTNDFDQAGQYPELDTAFVRAYQVVKNDYVFEMPEVWKAVGKMYLPGYILLIVNYSNPSANDLELFVYDDNATYQCSLPLAITMFSEGQVPTEATVNPEGLVSVLYKDQRSGVRKDFQFEAGKFVLVKTVQLPK